MPLGRLLLLLLPAVYFGGLAVFAGAVGGGKGQVGIIRLLVFTVLPPYAWFYAGKALLVSKLSLGTKPAVLLSVTGTAVAYICFTALLGLGANKHQHPMAYFVSLALAWFAVPIGYWLSWCRSLKKRNQ